MEKVNKSRLLIVTLYVLLATGLPSLVSSTAHAASVYDNLVKPVSTIKVNNYLNLSDTRDISNSFLDIMQANCNTAYNSLRQAMQNPQNGGRWTINQIGAYDMDTGAESGIYPSVHIYWTVTGGDNFHIDWDQYFGVEAHTSSSNSNDKIYFANITLDTSGNYGCASTNTSYQSMMLLTEMEYMDYNQPWYSTFDYDYPTDYAGAIVQDGQSVDTDGDGLNIVKEMQQQTSDSKDDSDKDGINDLQESIWYTDRDTVFCKIDPPASSICAYPDPKVQDIYVEVDWMNDTSTSTLYKPSSTQLGMVSDMFANEDINVHFDTGEFGGGNELASYTTALRQDSVANIPDFANYKNGGDGITANFASNRLEIWRYMIYGNFYSNTDGTSSSSGWAELLGDDLFISGGVVQDVPNSYNVNRADRVIANTIAHELGHGLCLSYDRVYLEQSSNCVFKGIDNGSGLPPTSNPDTYYNIEDYESVMNYRYQLTNQDDMGSVNYSHGPSSSTDHDDWSAVKDHIGGFNGTHTQYIEFGSKNNRLATKKPLSADGLIIAESHRKKSYK